MLCKAASSTCWLKCSCCAASPTAVRIVSTGVDAPTRADSTSSRAIPAPTTAVSSRSTRITRSTSGIGSWAVPRNTSSIRAGSRNRAATWRSATSEIPPSPPRARTRTSPELANTTTTLSSRLADMPTARRWPVLPCQRLSNGPLTGASEIGISTSSSQARVPAANPARITCGEVRGRHTASSIAGASCDSALNDTSPKSSSASTSPIARL